MIRQNLHAHSLFDDGRASCEEMVRGAIAAGLSSFGLSVHSPMPGESWTAPKERLPAFRAEMARLKERYAGRIRLWTGIEYDLVSEPDFGGFDYVIASVHAIDCAGVHWAVDDTRERAREMIDRAFSGDRDAAAAHYFSLVKGIARMDEADIVGHFDLLTKFNEPEPLYDTASPAYRRAALDAMEALAAAGRSSSSTPAPSAAVTGRTSIPPPGCSTRCGRWEAGSRSPRTATRPTPSPSAFARRRRRPGTRASTACGC